MTADPEPGPQPLSESASAGWRPATAAEAGMAAAADLAGYLAALGTGPLLLPVSAETAAGQAPFAWPTVEHDGAPHVLAFTSPQAIAAGLPGESVRYVTVTLAEVVATIPDDSWWLAVDPGLPIAHRITAGQLRELAPSPDAGDIARALRAAVAAEDPDAVMAALLRVEFTVPMPPDADPDAAATDLADPRFPWWCLPDEAGQPSVPVFTSPAMLAEVFDVPPPSVVASSVRLFANWPDPRWQLAVNPGTASAVSLPGEAVRQVSRWLDELRRTVTEGADADRADADRAGADPDVPVRMQLVVPHRHLHAFVADGYDRMAGPVHRWHGPGRDTPDRLYARLGLLGPESPFTAADEWVPVVRWEPGPDTPVTWLDERPQQRALAVPDGAELHVLHQDGRDELLARFDRGGRRWLPVEPPPAASIG
ncbi:MULTISPECIES: SseB family protein [unclassified Solwaraspora]|uniref:SseB family protein n=1 Tax=unclassified Solwaraspora TaxID=2627926 RepID=UPI00248AFC15|nr:MULTISPECIES: SseB family protein [unclassified Solwaraspora]WBB97132.1 SseB family protein [Solwaraspora sp. WMMA2059]WBC18966.1 SseB family protein [Solwaraspora sp. WMMA2080]WJK33603.1 SseB family protein [Solwaraspora sp. WMMA2065]